MTKVTIRPARPEDSTTIAQLFLISSDGLAEYIWSKVAEPGETALDAGARRYAREGVAFSYQNCVLAEDDGTVIGMAHSFPMDADPEAEPEADPVLRPYAELEDYGSLYLSGIALFAEHRGRRLGFKELARRPVVPHPLLHYPDGDAVLLAKAPSRFYGLNLP